MTVVNPKSISGINSITTGSGSDNLLTIHTSDASSTERVRINSSGDVIVGSGITVSPDGDVFATGVTTATTFVGALTGNVTGNVTGNISGGTVAGSTGTFTGDVAVSGANITLQDSGGATDDRISIGAGGDIHIYHNGTDSYVSNATGDLNLFSVGGNADDVIIRAQDDIELQPNNGEAGIKVIGDGAVELYHNNGIRLSTTSTGINVSQAGSGSVSNFSHGGGAGGVRIAGPAASSGANLIFANNFDNSVSDEWAIQLDGATDDLIFKSEGAGGTARVRLLDNGGICFGTDTATANALDDYEEGTWTPTVTAGGSAFHTTSASYVKIGRMVFVSFDLTNNSGGNIASVFGLPFAVDKYAAFNLAWVSNNQQGAQGASDIQGGLITTSTNNLGFRVAGGNNTQNVANNVRFIGSGAYETSA